MALFRNTSFKTLRAKRVYLDLDGTIVPDGEEELAPHEAHVLHELQQGREVYVVSNKGLVRGPRVADAHGIKAVVSHYKKPNPRVLKSLERPSEGAVVIGDKVLTDGIFAWRIGADFIKVDSLRAPTDDFLTRVSYALDSAVWSLCRALFWIRMSTPFAFLELMRPKQWIKNLLIFAPLFFAGGFFDPDAFTAAAIAFVAFSIAASAGYSINDTFDCAEDRRHPTKCTRPIASGRVSMFAASLFAFALGLVAVWTASFVPAVIPWIGLYFVLSYMYTTFAKQIPVIEFIAVAAFYIIRVLAGGDVIQVPVTGWLILTTFFAALFVTVGKRYAEAGTSTRSVLRYYPPEFMAVLPAVTATLVLVSYALYSLIGSVKPGLVYSNLFVLVGVLWYLRGIYARDGVEHPDKKLWSDSILLFTIVCWGFYVLLLFYFA